MVSLFVVVVIFQKKQTWW